MATAKVKKLAGGHDPLNAIRIPRSIQQINQWLLRG